MAYVPTDGDSCWKLTTDAYRAHFITGAEHDGYCVAPPPRLDPRATPQSLASFVQRLRLVNDIPLEIKRTYVYLTGWRGSPFGPTYERLRDDPRWTIHVRASAHDIMREAPDELAQILLAGTEASNR
jgi:hypothetical protein